MKITKTPSGAYRARVFLYRDETGKQHFKSITAPSKTEVQIAVAAFLRDREDHDPSSGSFTVGSAIDAYIEDRRSVLSPTTIVGYKTISKNHLSGISGKRLSELKESDIQQTINQIASECSPKTVRNASALLSAVLKKARPALKYDALLPQKRKPDIRVPTRAEYESIISNLDGDAKTAVILAGSAGLRRGEILALRWSRVDLDRKTIRIDASSAVGEDGKTVLKAPKTTDSERTIRMTPAVFTALSAIKKKDRGEFVCPIHPATLFSRYRKAQVAARISSPYRFHDLRHYFVSSCIALSVPKKYIAAMVGHSTERMIDAVYGHIMADKRSEIDDLMERFFR